MAYGAGIRGIVAWALALSLVLPTIAGAQPAVAPAEAPGSAVLVPLAAPDPGRDAPPVDLETLVPIARLPPAADAAPDALEALEAWNRQGNRPPRNGFLRPLPRPETIVVTARDAASPGARPLAGGVLSVDADHAVWVASVEVEAAHALRARLGIDSLPEGARVRSRGEDGEPSAPVGPELTTDEGHLWLPPVPGPAVSVEISVPRSALAAGRSLRVRLEDVLELVDLGEPTGVSPKVATPCEIDGRCVGTGTLSVIDDYRHAVARLLFSKDGFSYLCTGSLVGDTDDATTIPYLLTAHHCFSTQASASSLVAYFDYFPATCGGPPPNLASVPQVAGSTLLATGATSDFTLVELSALPAGYNYLLGWTTRDLVEGETLFMLSHPEGRRQGFSTSGYTESPDVSCGPFAGLFYADQLSGSTLGGSSGASVIVDEGGGQIVGQLLGACVSSPFDDCDYETFNEVDGAFRVTFPFVADYLAPSAPALSVIALDDQAAEPSDAGAFRISRTGSLGAPAPVTVAVGGTATGGTDYAAIASPVTIPAGQASVDVPVDPIDDVEDEGPEDVTLALVSSPGYAIGEPSSAAVTLADDEGPDCRSVVVAETVLASGDAAACGRLHLGPDVTIGAAGPVGLFAGTSVVLYDGFATGPGASLSVSTCSLDLCVSASAVPASAGCHPCVAQVCAADPYCCGIAWDAICVGEVGSICGLSCP